MNFTIIEKLDDPRIIPFLLNDDRASIYHHPAWLKAISNSYNYPAYYLILENPPDKEILGLFPFVVKNNFRKSKRTICLPSTTYYDPLFPDGFDMDPAITELVKFFGDRLHFDFKFRSNPIIKDLNVSSNYYNHIIKLGTTIDQTYNALGRRSIKRFIKKSNEHELKLRFGVSEADLKIFYELEVKLRKSIGLPPAPYKFFYSIWNSLKQQDMIMLPIIEYNSLPIAASLVLKFKDTFHFEYTAIDKKYLDLYPNHKLHWDIIKIAQTEYNVKYIDMGRTDINQESLIYFKEKWNAKSFPLYHFNISSQKRKNKKRGSLYKLIRGINKILPANILELEGKILFPYFD
jgi:hypothetical protein